MSRIVFVILLALNLGALAWSLTRPVRESQRLPPTELGVAPLTLLSERDAAAMQDAARRVQPVPSTQTASLPAETSPAGPDPVVAPVAAPVSLACESLGPFGDRDGAQEAVSELRSLTEQLQVRSTKAKVVRGYWVYIPPFPNRTDALATARQLAAAGVRDYYVVTAGEQENGIALGLFRDQANATTRHKQVTSLGFAARVIERADEREQFWIDYSYRVGAAPDWKAVVSGASRLKASSMDCPATGSNLP